MRLFPCIAAAAAASTLMLSSVTALAQTVRIGFIAPLTGGSSDFGISARYGAELAINEINEVGGFMGRKFELVVRDDKADPATGFAASQDLVLKEKVHFTIGFCNTGVAMKSLEVFQKNAHVLMVPCSQGTALTKTYPAQSSYIFRVAPRTSPTRSSWSPRWPTAASSPASPSLPTTPATAKAA
ncbi:ABC transporter substrate-binding protein [Rhizobacter sp. J219]|uniref:ABC transporter substrate-binding protein n=1 Tax=Rhizobacter sp. J219 TaxID=2898430 RepID=UPI002151C568|nr:ABC transporter substrate-binding protein [Rhizobacter sp. J219]